jgi:hypothetical protein
MQNCDALLFDDETGPDKTQMAPRNPLNLVHGRRTIVRQRYWRPNRGIGCETGKDDNGAHVHPIEQYAFHRNVSCPCAILWSNGDMMQTKRYVVATYRFVCIMSSPQRTQV